MDTALFQLAVREIAAVAGRARIERVQQRGPLFALNLRGDDRSIIIAVGGSEPHLYLGRRHIQAEGHPPMFCMLLRKHLEGSLLTGVEVPPFERWARLQFSGHSQFGDDRRAELMVEIMGRRSNLVLVGPSGVILDAYRRAGADRNARRPVWPGLPYEPPPPDPRPLPTTANSEMLSAALGKEVKKARDLMLLFAGLSPELAEEAWTRAGGGRTHPHPERLASELRLLGEAVRSPAGPALLYPEKGDRAEILSAIPLHHREEPSPVVGPLGDLMDRHLETAARREEEAQERSRLLHWLDRELSWREKRWAAVSEEARRREFDLVGRAYGELILANGDLGRSGLVSLTAWSGETIPLDPERDLLANAQDYFQRYRRAKRALTALMPEKARLESEMARLRHWRNELETDSPETLEKLREQLVRTLIPGDPKAAAPSVTLPLRYRTSGGLEVVVGRNARENDLLTFGRASPRDIWFHVQRAPGSHCILRLPSGVKPTDADLLDAALIAAWHSRLRFSSHVPVDYTERRFVKKPRGAKPGMVTYQNFRTVIVEPSGERVAELSTS